MPRIGRQLLLAGLLSLAMAALPAGCSRPAPATAPTGPAGPAAPAATAATLAAADLPDEAVMVQGDGGLWAALPHRGTVRRLGPGESWFSPDGGTRFEVEVLERGSATGITARRLPAGTPVASQRLKGSFRIAAAGRDSTLWLYRYDGALFTLDLATGELRGPAADDRGSPALAWQNALAPDGSRLYTLGMNGGRWGLRLGYIDRATMRSGPELDLPVPGSADFDALLVASISVSPDGKSVYVASGGLRQLITVDTAAWRVTKSATWEAVAAGGSAAAGATAMAGSSAAAGVARSLARLFTAPVAAAKRVLIATAALSPDGRRLYVAAFRTSREGLQGDGIVAVEVSTGKLVAHWLAGRELDGLLAARDGRFLYAVVWQAQDKPARDLWAVATADGAAANVLPDFIPHPWRGAGVLPATALEP